MNDEMRKLLIVGDNPFQGISHLSQERARTRGEAVVSPVDHAADVVLASLKDGADGFSFSVSEVTLSILRRLRERKSIDQINLYAMVPYAFEYVRIAAQTGTPGLVKRFAKQVALSGDIRAVSEGFWSVVRVDPEGFMNTYLAYELSRIKSSAGKHPNLVSVLLNEVIGDMGLALDLDWLFRSFISYLSKRGITPGFNTRNFPYFVRKFNEWDINLDETLIVTPFNKAGFQMNPSKEECEKTLMNLSSPNVLAISVLAAGYYKPSMVVNYLAGLNNLKGVIAGVSSEQQALETFKLFREHL
ncbi:MAG: hypothetical protein ABSA75_07015 [Candidatus Bathyarchaeia archaeon]|jgi:hypothetical protein